MTTGSKIILPLCLVALWVSLPATPLGAYLGGPPEGQEGQGPPRRGMGPGEMRGPGGGRHGDRIRGLLARASELPVEQQEQALQSDEIFQNLPEEIQQRIRRQLAELNQMSPQERRAYLDRFRRGGGERPFRSLFMRLAPLSPQEQNDALEKDEFFQSLPPEARQRFLGHLDRFNQKPPEERKEILRRLQRFADLPPGRREEMRRRAQRFAEMDPAQREEARKVFLAWRQLAPERKKRVGDVLRQLEQAPPEERPGLLESSDAIADLDPQERQLVVKLWHLRQILPPPPPAHD